MPGGHSRHGGRNAGAECRRLRAGGGFGHRTGAGLRSEQHAFVEFTAAECGFAYRRSRFNSADRGRYIVTRVDYRLTPGGAPTVRYADLQRALAERAAGRELSLAEVAAAVRRLRQSKGMLLVEGDPDCRSAGSFFKNPVITEEQLRRIAEASEKEPPRFPPGRARKIWARSRFPPRG